MLFKTPSDWSHDGKWIVFYQLDPDTSYNLYTVPATGGTPTLAVRGRNRDVFGRDLAGRQVARLPGGIRRVRIPALRAGVPDARPEHPAHDRRRERACGGRRTIVNSSTSPANQKELWRVDVQPNGADLRVVGEPVKLGTLPPGLIGIDAMPDRQKFLALVPDRLGVGSITVVQNWLAGLGK